MLTFNELPLPCPEGLTLAELLRQRNLASARVATAVNGEFVPCAQRAFTVLRPGDSVLTFQAIEGG